MSRRYARDQSLPENVRTQLRNTPSGEILHVYANKLFEAGWTIRAIAEPFSPKKSRSTVQYWIKMGKNSQFDLNLEIFDVPIPLLITPEGGYQRLTPLSPGLTTDVERELRELAIYAKTYRSGMSSTSLPAVSNDRLNELVKELVSQGVKVAEIARAANVTHRAISRRANN